MKHFELWTADLPVLKNTAMKVGRRPVIIVSDNSAITNPSLISVVPLTKDRSSPQLPTHVLLCNRYLDYPSRALCEQVLTLDSSRLRRRIGFVEAPFDRFAINRALSLHLNLPFEQGIFFAEPPFYTPLHSA